MCYNFPIRPDDISNSIVSDKDIQIHVSVTMIQHLTVFTEGKISFYLARTRSRNTQSMKGEELRHRGNIKETQPRQAKPHQRVAARCLNRITRLIA